MENKVVQNDMHKMIERVLPDRRAVYVSDLGMCGCLGGFVLAGWMIMEQPEGVLSLASKEGNVIIADPVKGGWEFVKPDDYRNAKKV